MDKGSSTQEGGLCAYFHVANGRTRFRAKYQARAATPSHRHLRVPPLFVARPVGDGGAHQPVGATQAAARELFNLMYSVMQ